MPSLLGRVVLAGLVLVSAGCVTDTRPDAETCARPRIEIALRLTVDGLEPETPAVCRGQEVTFVVDSEVDGVLHVHGYDDQVPAFFVSAGATEEVEFRADVSGQFVVEFHAQDDPQGVGVGVFTVHEP